jgi:copper/silver efflux system protein
VGAMTPGAVVLIENAHKWLERWNQARAKRERDGDGALTAAERETASLSRFDLIVLAAKQVGRPLFFSLLIITVSFLPVFALHGESGRLFKPLAYTKTFSMFFAALLTVTLVPILMVWFIRGKIAPEHRHPISRFFGWLYRPFVSFVLRFRWLTLLLALVVLVATWYPLQHIGSEFMPPLNEGTLLFMPSSVPGISITEAKKILQRQDAAIMTFPEVAHVYGKVGRAQTATDPAPLAMTETIITLKPEDQWRPGMTIEKIQEGLQKLVRTPGAPSVWWMPIQTRIEMLSTGIRSQIGITIYGPNLNTIQKIGTQIEAVLKRDPHSVSVFAERIGGGYYLHFKINRPAIARYGLTVASVEHVIQSAIGGMPVSTVIKGRERYPINVRYGPALRQNLPALRRVLVGTPSGAQVPMEQLADIYVTNGPAFVRDENGMLNAFVFVDTKGIDLGSYVAQAKKLIADHVHLPPGYYLGWGGQYQYMQEARKTLTLVIPMTLLIIFVLLYLNFGNPMEVFLVLLTLPFSMVGGIWYLWALHYNFSVAVAVGFIALAGVATEIGVVMIVYLDEAWTRLKGGGGKPTYGALVTAVREGAVQRVRPVMMTFFAITAGLLPIMWSQGTGALAMKRIAAPMIGGMISTVVLTLLIVPVVYFLWRSRSVEAPPAEAKPARKLLTGTVVAGLLVLGIGGWWLWHRLSGPAAPTVIVTQQTVGPYRFEVFSSARQLHKGTNPVRIRVTDAASGKPVDVGSVWFKLQMSMPGMSMQATAQLEKGQGPGVFNGTIQPGGQGEWHASVGYENRQGKNSTSFTINVGP